MAHQNRLTLDHRRNLFHNIHGKTFPRAYWLWRSVWKIYNNLWTLCHWLSQGIDSKVTVYEPLLGGQRLHWINTIIHSDHLKTVRLNCWSKLPKKFDSIDDPWELINFRWSKTSSNKFINSRMWSDIFSSPPKTLLITSIKIDTRWWEKESERERGVRSLQVMVKDEDKDDKEETVTMIRRGDAKTDSNSVSMNKLCC